MSLWVKKVQAIEPKSLDIICQMLFFQIVRSGGFAALGFSPWPNFAKMKSRANSIF
jgi:hypothetical protein